jgi:hypothetical protein
MTDKIKAYRISIGTPLGKRPLEGLGADGRLLNWVLVDEVEGCAMG